jgi:hypothetical protein
MQAASQVPAGKLKFLALVLCAVSLGFFVWTVVGYGGFPFLYLLWPIFLALFCVAPDEKKVQVVSNKIGAIVIYVVFGTWIAFFIWDLINTIRVFNANMDIPEEWRPYGFIHFLPLFGLQISFGLAAIVGGLYFHNYKTGVALNGGQAPLLNTHV